MSAMTRFESHDDLIDERWEMADCWVWRDMA